LRDSKLDFEFTEASQQGMSKAEGDGDEGSSELEPETAE